MLIRPHITRASAIENTTSGPEEGLDSTEAFSRSRMYRARFHLCTLHAKALCTAALGAVPMRSPHGAVCETRRPIGGRHDENPPIIEQLCTPETLNLRKETRSVG